MKPGVYRITKSAQAGDLTITSDIPLAAEAMAKGGHTISPRGERHTKDNIRARLNMRDFMDTLRVGIAEKKSYIRVFHSALVLRHYAKINTQRR